MIEITMSIKGKVYTIDEARELYEELSKIFKDKEYLPYIPYPCPEPPLQSPSVPIMPYYTTHPVTCETKNQSTL